LPLSKSASILVIRATDPSEDANPTVVRRRRRAA
jgi:hypothetical protein